MLFLVTIDFLTANILPDSSSCLAARVQHTTGAWRQDIQCSYLCNVFDIQRHFSMAAAAGLASQQAAALLKIKEAIDPSNQLSDWRSGASNACSFSGVTCNAAQEVTELYVSYLSFSFNTNLLVSLAFVDSAVLYLLCCANSSSALCYVFCIVCYHTLSSTRWQLYLHHCHSKRIPTCAHCSALIIALFNQIQHSHTNSTLM